MPSPVLDPTAPIRDLLGTFPSARRALFAHFHIGGCQSCAFSEENSLEQVCRDNEIDLEKAIQVITESHEEEQALLLEPSALQSELSSEGPPIIIDTRTREEFEAVPFPNAELLTDSTISRLSSQTPPPRVILFDHSGQSVLNHVSWFRGHGLNETFALAGGIDRYAQEVDPSIPRYRLEVGA